jgi:hypothetical protein
LIKKEEIPVIIILTKEEDKLTINRATTDNLSSLNERRRRLSNTYIFNKLTALDSNSEITNLNSSHSLTSNFKINNLHKDKSSSSFAIPFSQVLPKSLFFLLHMKCQKLP